MRYLFVFLLFFSTKLLLPDSCISGNCVNGKGTKLLKNGNKYEGNFRDGKFYGFGIYTSQLNDPDGKPTSTKIYTGEWKNNKKNGKGKLTINSNGKTKVYSGFFLDGKLNGLGMLETTTEKFVGKFKDNKLNGYGSFENDKGEKYTGGFSNHKFDGKGTYTFKDKSLYIGDFKDGKFHGKGRMFSNKHKILKSGRWVNGAFQE